MTVPDVYRRHLTAATTDAAGLRAVWEPDGVLEFPYARALGTPERLEGIDAIIDYFSGLAMFRDFTFRDVEARKIEGLEEWVLEAHGSATLAATGRPYEQDYIVRFGVSPSGRLSWMREFWDPTRAG